MSPRLSPVALVPFLLLTACSNATTGASSDGSGGVDFGTGPEVSSGGTSGAVDVGLPTVDVAPQTTLTLETAVDPVALAAAVVPQVVEFRTATQPDAAFDEITVGRPWAEFDLFKGPRLVFRGTWRVLARRNGQSFSVVEVIREGETYRMIGIGATVLASTMEEREAIPAVSAALDRGRVGLLRCPSEGGNSLLAYEDGAVEDAGQADIRVQPLFGNGRFRGIDAGAGGEPEMSLEQFDAFLP